jgi:hypothetical protein
VIVAAEACRRFSEDKRSGALELILCTPLKVQALLRGQSMKIFRLFLIPVLAVGILNLILGPLFGGQEDRYMLYRGGPILLLDCWALTWVGMWNGVKAKRFSHAVLGTMARVMIPPWIVVFAFIATNIAGSTSNSAVRSFFAFWFFLVLVYDLWLVARFNSRLKAHFRSAATGEPGRKREKSQRAEVVDLRELSSTPQAG